MLENYFAAGAIRMEQKDPGTFPKDLPISGNIG